MVRLRITMLVQPTTSLWVELKRQPGRKTIGRLLPQECARVDACQSIARTVDVPKLREHIKVVVIPGKEGKQLITPLDARSLVAPSNHPMKVRTTRIHRRVVRQ